MNDPKTVNLCSRCCEVVYSFREHKDICAVKETDVPSNKPWHEGQDPHDVCESYRGPLGIDWDDWWQRFAEVFAEEAKKALDEGTLRPSELVRALCS